MTKEIFTCFLGISICIVSSAQNYKYKPENSVILDSSQGKGLLVQCSRRTPQHITGLFNLDTGHIKKLENNFKKIFQKKDRSCCVRGFAVSNLKDYAFQYTGIIIHRTKYIYINAFRLPSQLQAVNFFESWKTEPVMVCDGGDDFWGVLFNLKTETFSQLAFNGEG